MSEHEDGVPAADEAESAAQQEAGDGETALDENELNEMIEGLCHSKAEEFRMLGYEHVTGREVWECVSDKYGKKGYPPLHQS
ncbi:post-transcriptional regulator [Gordoniibacillus kamchatkensis]|uniref:post-transcriptional regulator n=1 Tax=Gordoniibacillus kamchatkensis TaxID=1590651 RepID=UPI000B0B79DC